MTTPTTQPDRRRKLPRHHEICPRCGTPVDFTRPDLNLHQMNSTPNIRPSPTEPVQWQCPYCESWILDGKEVVYGD